MAMKVTAERVRMLRVTVGSTTQLLTEQEAITLHSTLGQQIKFGSDSIRENIIAATCAFYNTTREEVMMWRRTNRIVWPRQVAMYLFRELTTDTLEAIGRAFKRDHGTVTHAWGVVRNRILTEPKIAHEIAVITERVTEK